MKIFNKSQRMFVHHDTRLQPGSWSEIPDEAAEKLLKTYPHELTSSESKGGPGAAEVVEAKNEEITVLKGQVAKLTKIVESDDVDSKAAANRKAAKLELDLAEAKALIAELQKKVDAPKITLSGSALLEADTV